MTKNQTALVQKIARLKTLEKQSQNASMLTKASLADAAIQLSIQVLEHIAMEIIPNGK